MGGLTKCIKKKRERKLKKTRPKMRPSFFLLAWREISSSLHCVLVLIASTPEFRKDMVKVASSATGIAAMQALFKKNHAPATRTAEAMAVYKQGEELALMFVNDMAGLKLMVQPLFSTLSGLDSQEKAARKVMVPKGTAAKDICELANQFAKSDARFGPMDKSQLQATVKLGDILREARLTGVSLKGFENERGAWKVLKEEILKVKGWTSEAEWTATKILDKVTMGKEAKFQVLWEDGSTTWEPLENLKGTADALIKEFEKRSGQQTGKRARSTDILSESDEDFATPEKVVEERDSELKDALLATMNMVNALAGEVQKGRDVAQTKLSRVKKSKRSAVGDSSTEEQEDEEEEEDVRLPRDRPVLQGDKRRKLVGSEHFKRERELQRKYSAMKMLVTRPFSEEYNKRLQELCDVEGRMMEYELKLKKAQKVLADQPTSLPLVEKVGFAQAALSYHEERWTVLDDLIALLEKCATLAEDGKHSTAHKVYERALRSAEESSENKTWRKLYKAADKELREERDLDRGVVLNQMLGHQSASRQTSIGGGPPPSLSYPPPPPPLPGHQSSSTALPAPRPLPPLPWNGQGPKTPRETGASAAKRCLFKTAEEVVNPCPSALKGTMVPVGMKFFLPGKLLDSPPKDRGTNEFSHACKVCGMMPPQVKGHEAWECLQKFEVSGKPGRTYRELYQMGACDKFGKYN